MATHREEIGRILREARERAGLSLREIAQVIRIRPVYLQAIEAGRFDQLPALPQTVGFTRTYAEYLRVDVEEPLSNLGREVHQNILERDYSGPDLRWNDMSRRRIAYIAVGGLIGIAALAVLFLDLDKPYGEITQLNGTETALTGSAPASSSSSSIPLTSLPGGNQISAHNEMHRNMSGMNEDGSTIIPSAHGSSPVSYSFVTGLAASMSSAAIALPAGQGQVAASTADTTVDVVATASAEPGTSIFATRDVHFRAAPSNAGEILGVLNGCERLVPVADSGSTATHWQEVIRSDGARGFVYRGYLSANESSCS